MVVELMDSILVAIPRNDEKQGYLPIDVNVIVKDGVWQKGTIGRDVKVKDGRSILDTFKGKSLDVSQKGQLTVKMDGGRSIVVDLVDATAFDTARCLCMAITKTSEKTTRLDEELSKSIAQSLLGGTKSSKLNEDKAREMSAKRRLYSAVSGGARPRKTIEKGLK